MRGKGKEKGKRGREVKRENPNETTTNQKIPTATKRIEPKQTGKKPQL